MSPYDIGTLIAVAVTIAVLIMKMNSQQQELGRKSARMMEDILDEFRETQKILKRTAEDTVQLEQKIKAQEIEIFKMADLLKEREEIVRFSKEEIDAYEGFQKDLLALSDKICCKRRELLLESKERARTNQSQRLSNPGPLPRSGTPFRIQTVPQS